MKKYKYYTKIDYLDRGFLIKLANSLEILQIWGGVADIDYVLNLDGRLWIFSDDDKLLKNIKDGFEEVYQRNQQLVARTYGVPKGEEKPIEVK